MNFQSFWGKARALDGVGPRMHPVWKHSLDVAAVGRRLTETHRAAFERLADLFEWNPEDTGRMFVFMLALHDIGKFSRVFQKKVDHCWPADVLGPLDEATRRAADPGHPATGLGLVLDHWLPARGGRIFPGWDPASFLVLLGSVLGHHGRPVDPCETDSSEVFDAPARAAALAFAEAVEALFDPPPVMEPPSRVLRQGSWMIAGLTVIADWVASDQRWFPYCNKDLSLEAYWARHALPRARRAIGEAGLEPSVMAPAVGFQALADTALQPTPVQKWAETVELPPGPLLLVVEDMTGSGKTEAALILAHRLMVAGRARGLYLALPTMATANAMYRRLAATYRRLYARDARPSLALAHGSAHLHPQFNASIFGPGDAPRAADDDTDQEADSAAESTAWLASESRKALLADIGVGTIDQALLSVLPVKYQCLRLIGLAERVLIIDEAHAYDAYMGAELDRLVAFQAAMGGHTIVLSATLPAVVRNRLAKAWAEAADARSQELVRGDYPLTTRLACGQSPLETAPPTRTDLRRTIAVTRVSDRDAALDRVRRASEAGAAVAWIRNTVDDAIDGAECLREQGIEAQLFHARFAMGDRLEIERDVIGRFGKTATSDGRAGAVLVATQVIEQSLDLDFDLIVSDLAPIDLLIQRAGRLWRHMNERPVSTRSVSGPELVVMSPDPSGPIDENWIRSAFPRASKIYEDHLILWRTAEQLFGRGELKVPEDVRLLVEAVYGHDLEPGSPPALGRIHETALGKLQAARGFARQNLLNVGKGYLRTGQSWLNESEVRTRLGEETRVLRLATWDGSNLEPWCADEDPRRAWALSEVTVRQGKVRGVPALSGAPAVAATELRASWGRYEEDKLLLPLEAGPDGLWSGTVLDPKDNPARVSYTRAGGLRF